MRVLVMGAGAMGSAVGGFLAKAGHRVTLVGRAPHIEIIRTQGLRITGIWGEHCVSNLETVTDPASLEPGSFDLILITVKSYDTRAAVAAVAPLFGDHTLVCSYQNGLGNAEVIAEAAGWRRTVGARAIYGVWLSEPGTAEITVIANPTALGVYSPDAPADRVRAIAGAMNRSYSAGDRNVVDLTATSLFTFIIEKFNPFDFHSPKTNERLSLSDVQPGEVYAGEDFESNTLGFYTLNPPKNFDSETSLNYDGKVKKSGNRSLRFQFVSGKTGKSFSEVTRSFYPHQNFSEYSRLRFWLYARSSNPRPGIMGLKIRLILTDADGNVAQSGYLNYSARGVDNTIMTPRGFVPTGKSFNYGQVKAMAWRFEESGQDTWNIHVDDIVLE